MAGQRVRIRLRISGDDPYGEPYENLLPAIPPPGTVLRDDDGHCCVVDSVSMSDGMGSPDDPVADLHCTQVSPRADRREAGKMAARGDASFGGAPRRLISSGSRFEEEIGYSRAVVDGDHVWVSGTTGYDYKAMTIAEGVVDQAEQCFRNIAAALGEAGCILDDVVRALFILPRREDWPACWPVVRHHFGIARPAATMIQAGLQDEAMRIEIEVTARLRKDMP